MLMPAPDQATVARRRDIAADLRRIVPREAVIEGETERRAYESDGLTAYRTTPLLAVLPATTAQVAAVLRYCFDHRIKVVPRGAGTSLSGGALPLADGIILGMAKFNRIKEIDLANRCVVVEPGVTNLGISNAVNTAGFFYAPDPSSQIACTIGGNVAENSGGVHCLKYGLTTNNVLGVELVTIEGEIVRLGGKQLDAGGYDLLGVTIGSEGLLGVVTEVTVRILPKPTTARALLIGFPIERGCRQLRRRDHRRRHHSRRHGDDGHARDQRRRGFRPGRLSARGRRAADRRTRRPASRSRASDRAGRENCARQPRHLDPHQQQARSSACASGPGARRRFRRSAASRPTITASTAPSRARNCPRC